MIKRVKSLNMTLEVRTITCACYTGGHTHRTTRNDCDLTMVTFDNGDLRSWNNESQERGFEIFL